MYSSIAAWISPIFFGTIIGPHVHRSVLFHFGRQQRTGMAGDIIEWLALPGEISSFFPFTKRLNVREGAVILSCSGSRKYLYMCSPAVCYSHDRRQILRSRSF